MEYIFNKLTEAIPGDWNKMVINHQNTSSCANIEEVYKIGSTSKDNLKVILYLYSTTDGNVLYIGEGWSYRIIDHYAESQWPEIDYENLFSCSKMIEYAKTQEILKKNHIRIAGKIHSINQVKFFSNPMLKSTMYIYWLVPQCNANTLKDRKKYLKNLEGRLFKTFFPIYNFKIDCHGKAIKELLQNCTTSKYNESILNRRQIQRRLLSLGN